MSHRGLVLRVSIPAGPLMQADSVTMHLQALLSGAQVGGWHELIRTTDGLVIEVSPVLLDDLPPDDEDQDDDEDAV